MKLILLALFALIFCSFAVAIENDNLVQEELKGIERLHEFLPANVTGLKYCPTEDIWKWKQAVRNEHGSLGKRQGSCATNGICDSYATRNRYDSFNLQIPLYITVLCASSTNCPFNEARVIAQISQVNQDFAGTGITFHINHTRFVVDSQYAEIDAYSSNNIWYTQITNLKNKHAHQPNNFLNCFVTKQKSGSSGTLLGIGTFPWDTASNGNTGGLWMNANYVGAGYKTFAHEIGHCVGLWHTFHGDSEVSCSSACYETVHQDFSDTSISNTVGDFCADTPAQPMNYNCQIPTTRDCKGLLYRDCPTSQQPTLTNNIMAYTPDTCMQKFTSQQSTRARCWTCEGRVKNWVLNQCRPRSDE